MSTFTKEQLIEKLQHRISVASRFPESEKAQMDLELARIALASLEAEPYGYVHKAAYEQAGSCGLSGDHEAYRDSSTHIAVYTATPAPVSVPAAMEIDDDFDSAFEHGKAVGWNAYRAAMLQSGNFRENKNSSTNNFREIAETSTNYPVIPSEVLSAILKVAKIRADFDDFDGDRRGIGDCLDEAEQELIVTINKYASQLAVVPVGLDERAAFNAWNNDENLPIAGVGAKNAAWLAWQARAELGRSLAVNSPVISDSWISCSERMPNDKQYVWCWGKSYGWTECDTFEGYYDWSRNKWWAVTDDGEEPASKVTHWMPLPEPPQEAKRWM